MPEIDKDAIIARLLRQRQELLTAINTGIVNLGAIVYKDHGDPRFEGWMRMMGEVHANPAYRDDPTKGEG